MESESAGIPFEELLADATWIRSLAGSLVRDAAAADDIVQETWRAALANPPTSVRPGRPWLRTVVTNAARKLFREEGRRRARERATARPEASRLPGPAELAERLETQRMLAGLVADLAEPFRSTVLLRFWEGLSCAEIARRQDTPAGTVRWRLKKALDDLRDRLDLEHDGRRAAWIPLLLPIAEPLPVVATAGGGLVAAVLVGLGGWLTVKKIVAVAAVLLLLVIGVRISGVIGSPPEPDDPQAPRERETAHVVSSGNATDEDEAALRDAGSSKEETAVVASAPAGTAVVRLRLRDADGGPVEGARIRPGWRHPVVRSPADGDVTMRLPMDRAETSIRVEVRAPGFASRTFPVTVRRGERSDLGIVVLDPGGAVTGVVVGSDDRPARRTVVKLTRPDGPFDLELGRRLNGPTSDWSTAADAQGRFRLEGIPTGFWHVWAGAEGMRWNAVGPVEVRADRAVEGLRIALEPLDPTERFEGVVRTPDGKPFPGALIEFSIRTETGVMDQAGTFTSEKARFRILNPRGAVGDFRARDPKGRFGEARVLGHPAGGGEVVLTLTAGSPLIVRVVDEKGAAVPAFTVHLLDAATDREIGMAPGAEGRAETVSPVVPYRVRVFAPGHASTTVDGGGDEVRILIRRHSPIEGIVLVDDRPRVGARVRVHALADPNTVVTCCDFRVWLRPRPLAETVSADDGSFRLQVAAGGKMLVRVDVDGYAPAESRTFEFDPLEGLTGLKIVAHPGGSIAGRVAPAGGGDPTGTIVGISRGDGYGCTTRTGADGAFRFDHLVPGRWQVVVREKEILPGSIGTGTSFGSGRPIPYNCEVREGETTTHDLVSTGVRSCLDGRLLIDGRAPSAWTAALYPAGGGFIAKAKAGITSEGTFRLGAAGGDYRLLLSAPGRAFTSMVVTADLALTGNVRWECILSTGTLDLSRPETGADEVVLFHRFACGNGALVLTPLPSGGGKTRVPAGPGEVVRFDLRTWTRPDLWPVVAEVDVPSAGRKKVRLGE